MPRRKEYVEARGNVAPPPHPVLCQAERAAYLKWMAGRCFHYLSCKHLAVDCTEPLKYWRFYKDYHLASQCTLAATRKSSSTAPPSGPQLAVELDLGVPAGIASRPGSYAEALLAPSQGDRPAYLSDRRTPSCALVEQDLVAAICSWLGPIDNDVWWHDPMFVQAMAPPLQVAPVIKCLPICSAWCDDMILDFVLLVVGCEEYVDRMFSEALTALRPSMCTRAGPGFEDRVFKFSKHFFGSL